MSCLRCGRTPAKQVQLNIEGKLQAVCLCEACLRELFPSRKQNTRSAEETAEACPHCGTTFANFQATGLLGCARCYEVFYDELLPYVRGTQGKVEHRGKQAPSRSKQVYELLREGEKLRASCKEARARGDRELVERVTKRWAEIRRQLKEVMQ